MSFSHNNLKELVFKIHTAMGPRPQVKTSTRPKTVSFALMSGEIDLKELISNLPHKINYHPSQTI
jgi:hypothetical protein